VSEQDPLETLRDQIRVATEAAERLVRDVTVGAETGPAGARVSGMPRAGWESPPQTSETASELQMLTDLVQSLRDLLPADVQEQVTDVIRQLLLLVRALIDWIVARIEQDGRGQEIEVQDIPIT
jgi:hypothetical protein